MRKAPNMRLHHIFHCFFLFAFDPPCFHASYLKSIYSFHHRLVLILLAIVDYMLDVLKYMSSIAMINLLSLIMRAYQTLALHFEHLRILCVYTLCSLFSWYII